MTVPFQNIDAILFDLDGTLADTDDVAVAKLTGRLRPLLGKRAAAAARQFWMAAETPGNTFMTLLDILGLDEPMIRFKERRFQGHSAPHFPLIEGVEALIEQLAGRYPLALVSTRSRRHIDQFLAQHPAIAAALTTTCGIQDTRCLKPHPEPVQTAAARLKVPVERCLMVGDTAMDVRAGRRAGAWTAAVLCGYGTERELRRAGAHIILAKTPELGRLLNQ